MIALPPQLPPVVPPSPPIWRLTPAPGGIVNWGLRYAAQIFVIAFFLGGPILLLTSPALFAGALAGSIVVGLAIGAVYRATFSVEFTDLGMTVRRGILTTRQDFVPYARMQSVVVRQGPFQRLFGIADVLVQTAKQQAVDNGRASNRRSRGVDAAVELRFEGIARNIREHDGVRAFLLARSEQARVAPTPLPAPHPLARVVAQAAAPAVPDDLPWLFGEVTRELKRALAPKGPPPPPPERFDIALDPRARTLWTVRWSLTPIVLLGFTLPFFPAFSLALMTASVAIAWAAALVYWGHYRVDLGADSVRVSRGLLTLRQAAVPYRRIQNVNVSSGPLERLLGLKTLRIEAAGPHIAEGYIDGIHEAEPAVAFILTRASRARFDDALGDQVATQDARGQVADEVRALNALLESRVAPDLEAALGGAAWLRGEDVLSPRWPAAAAVSSLISGSLAVTVMAGFAFWWFRFWSTELWLSLFAFLALAPAAISYFYLRVRLQTFAFRFGPESLEVRHGVFFHNHDLIPYRRLQAVGIHSDPIGRWLFGIYTIRLTTAGTTTALSDFPGVVNPSPYVEFLLAKARESTPAAAGSAAEDLAFELARTAGLVWQIARRGASA